MNARLLFRALFAKYYNLPNPENIKFSEYLHGIKGFGLTFNRLPRIVAEGEDVVCDVLEVLAQAVQDVSEHRASCRYEKWVNKSVLLREYL